MTHAVAVLLLYLKMFIRVDRKQKEEEMKLQAEKKRQEEEQKALEAEKQKAKLEAEERAREEAEKQKEANEKKRREEEEKRRLREQRIRDEEERAEAQRKQLIEEKRKKEEEQRRLQQEVTVYARYGPLAQYADVHGILRALMWHKTRTPTVLYSFVLFVATLSVTSLVLSAAAASTMTSWCKMSHRPFAGNCGSLILRHVRGVVPSPIQ